MAANIYVYCKSVEEGLDRCDLEEALESFLGMPRRTARLAPGWLVSTSTMISRHESKAAKWCRSLEKTHQAPADYEDWLLPFVTSLSLRTALHGAESRKHTASYALAMRVWRRFLLGKRRDVLPFSQHVFIVFDEINGAHRMLCSAPDTQEEFVFTQFGPLFIAGLLGRSRLSLEEIKVWEHSEIGRDSGRIVPVSVWDDKMASPSFLRYLTRRQKQEKMKVDELMKDENVRTRLEKMAGKPLR